MANRSATSRARTITTSRPEGARRARRWKLAGALAGLAIVSGGVAYAVTGPTGDISGPPAATAKADGAAEAAEPVDFGHAHGLAVDHASGDLYVATHVGLFRVDGDHEAVRVSKEASDLMGFTAKGPGHFLASGHPGEDGHGPANLGLIESTDGGVTWQTTSLEGAADFHGLQAAHGAVYGYNSTDRSFMVSTDQQCWKRRSTVPLGDFVVSPTDPQTILAVGVDGLQRSTDAGRTWAVINGSPKVSTLAWDTGAQVWAAAADGTVWQSADGGATWQQRGRLPAQPQDLATHGSTIFAAVSGDQILASTDGGNSWTSRYAPQ